MKPIAVIDVETTGLNPYRHDRIVEVAVVLVDPQEGIISTLDTLINPERDIGPSSIHGLTSTDIINAPRFIDIASHIAAFMRPAVALAGHNLRFDISFLRAEYERIGVDMPKYSRLDTMALVGGGTLTACCSQYGISFDGQAHAALNDASVTASLLLSLLSKSPNILDACNGCEPPNWPSVQTPIKEPFSRARLQQIRREPPSYIQRLAANLSPSSINDLPPSAERDYRSLLWNVLEDGRIEASEGDALVENATRWGLGYDAVQKIHQDYLLQLAHAAWADRHLTMAERSEIQTAARLLGFGVLDENRLEDLLRSTERIELTQPRSLQLENWVGRSVCFTGECSCSILGTMISRTEAERIATEKGLKVMNSVTKKLDYLVVADPNTQSGKAQKARTYGVHIIHEPRFWRQLGINVD